LSCLCLLHSPRRLQVAALTCCLALPSYCCHRRLLIIVRCCRRHPVLPSLLLSFVEPSCCCLANAARSLAVYKRSSAVLCFRTLLSGAKLLRLLIISPNKGVSKC
jgi:hypothetical protein